mgnify:CR=1 FL=1
MIIQILLAVVVALLIVLIILVIKGRGVKPRDIENAVSGTWAKMNLDGRMMENKDFRERQEAR